jgi:hypothetical protein
MSPLTRKKSKSAEMRGRAQRKAAKAAPLARTAGVTVRRGAGGVTAWASPRVRGARAWAAPRVEQTGNVVQEKLAPQVSGLLTKTAQRLDPAPKSRRRSRLVRGIMVLGAAASALAVLAAARKKVSSVILGGSGAAAWPGAGDQGSAANRGGPAYGDAQVDANGQVRASS